MAFRVLGRAIERPPPRLRARHIAARGVCYGTSMCRSIKTLRRADEPATDDEIHAAALQFVRKVSGYRMPSQRNAAAFDAAVDEIARASRRLLDSVTRGCTARQVRARGATGAGVGSSGRPWVTR